MSDTPQFDEGQATLYPVLWGDLQCPQGMRGREHLRVAADSEVPGRVALAIGEDWFVLAPDDARKLFSQLQVALGAKAKSVPWIERLPVAPPLRPTDFPAPNPYSRWGPGKVIYGTSSATLKPVPDDGGHYRCEGREFVSEAE